MNHFAPLSPDPFIKTNADQGLAKFGHLNAVIDNFNQYGTATLSTASTAGGQASGTLLVVGVNLITTAITGNSATLPSLNTCPATTPCGCCNPAGPVVDGTGIYVVRNLGPGVLSIYPPLGNTIDGAAVNIPVTLSPGASISFVKTGCTTWAFVNCSIGCSVATDATLTGAGTLASPLSVVGTAVALAVSEYVQTTQAPNNSVASGLAFQLLTDNPTGVVNTIGIVTANAPTQGTAFQLPVGKYMVDYETSMSSVGPIAISKGASAAGPFTADITTKSGSTTATTWVHGRAYISSTVGGQWFIVGPTDGVAAAVTTAGGAPQYIVRVAFLKIG